MRADNRGNLGDDESFKFSNHFHHCTTPSPLSPPTNCLRNTPGDFCVLDPSLRRREIQSHSQAIFPYNIRLRARQLITTADELSSSPPPPSQWFRSEASPTTSHT